jgi:DNA-binding response OmpR family regulator
LVVEDEPDIAQLLVLVLEDAGYRLRIASDVRSALGAIGDRRPDLIVCDIHLPAGDGRDLVGRLRAGGYDRPVVFVSAGFPDGLPIGSVFIQKPFDVTCLLGAIANALAVVDAAALRG